MHRKTLWKANGAAAAAAVFTVWMAEKFRIVIVSFCLNCCWCWYVWCDCSMVLVDVCIAHTCWGCCFLPFVRVCLCLYACECRFCFPFSLEKVFNSFGSSFSMRIFSCAVFLVSCVHSIRVRINAISLLFFPTRIYCCWWWYLLCFCRFPSLKFNLFNLSLLNFFCSFFLSHAHTRTEQQVHYIFRTFTLCASEFWMWLQSFWGK